MKNYVVAIFIVLLALVFSSCYPKQKNVSSNLSSSVSLVPSSRISSSADSLNVASQESSSSNSIYTSSRHASSSLPVYVPGSIKLLPLDGDITEFAFVRHYRLVYYDLGSPFWDAVPDDKLNSWLAEVDEKSKVKEPTEMLLKAFVQKFKIPKSEFEKDCETYKQNELGAGLDVTQEEYEVPNADIIYTFDDKIISEYYRRA